MQAAFAPDRAVKRKLVQQIYMFGVKGLAGQIPPGHQILAWPDFMRRRSYCQKRNIKTAAIKTYKFIIFFSRPAKSSPASPARFFA